MICITSVIDSASGLSGSAVRVEVDVAKWRREAKISPTRVNDFDVPRVVFVQTRIFITQRK